jgi:hypothetical protein
VYRKCCRLVTGFLIDHYTLRQILHVMGSWESYMDGKYGQKEGYWYAVLQQCPSVAWLTTTRLGRSCMLWAPGKATWTGNMGRRKDIAMPYFSSAHLWLGTMADTWGRPQSEEGLCFWHYGQGSLKGPDVIRAYSEPRIGVWGDQNICPSKTLPLLLKSLFWTVSIVPVFFK